MLHKVTQWALVISQGLTVLEFTLAEIGPKIDQVPGRRGQELVHWGVRLLSVLEGEAGQLLKQLPNLVTLAVDASLQVECNEVKVIGEQFPHILDHWVPWLAVVQHLQASDLFIARKLVAVERHEFGQRDMNQLGANTSIHVGVGIYLQEDFV